MFFQNGSTLLMTGDSVTDVGRERPIGHGPLGLGTGYPNIVNCALRSAYPETKIQVLNTGISGDTSRGLLARVESDIISQNPDYVSIMIGINDVWRHFDREFITCIHISLDEYKSNMINIIEKIKPTAKIILFTPFFLELNKEDEMRSMTDKYAEICRELAKKYNLILCDIQSEFDKLLPILYTNKLSGDRVHPNPVSHFFIAKKFLETLDVKM